MISILFSTNKTMEKMSHMPQKHKLCCNSSVKCMLLQYVVLWTFAVAIGSLCWVLYVIRDDRVVWSREHTGTHPTESQQNRRPAETTDHHSAW